MPLAIASSGAVTHVDRGEVRIRSTVTGSSLPISSASALGTREERRLTSSLKLVAVLQTRVLPPPAGARRNALNCRCAGDGYPLGLRT